MFFLGWQDATRGSVTPTGSDTGSDGFLTEHMAALQYFLTAFQKANSCPVVQQQATHND